MGSTRAAGVEARAWACWTSASTARDPASSVRSARVVSAGLQKSEPTMLSKPTTLTSPGTSTPRSASRSITPIASMSLCATTAVAPEASTASAAAGPPARVGT
nr:hypothetical protein [Nocardioides ungokensis]